jgi:branched-chain amino acid transport system permease protein
MGPFAELLLNAVVSGALLGAFYAAVALGVAVAFGMLDIPNLAHPAFVMLGAFATYTLTTSFGLDPILAGILMTPPFFLLGMALYAVYDLCFESRGKNPLAGLAFFFGVMFITEVLLVLLFGADYRSVQAPYIGPDLQLGPIDLPTRMLVPAAVSLAMIGGLALYLRHAYTGRAILAVSQDSLALRLMSISPYRIKLIAIGLAIATASIAGALLIVIEPVEPSLGRDFIGRAFAVVVLGGMGRIGGMLVASLLLGIAESLTSTLYDPSLAPAIAFGFLLPALALRARGRIGSLPR